MNDEFKVPDSNKRGLTGKMAMNLMASCFRYVGPGPKLYKHLTKSPKRAQLFLDTCVPMLWLAEQCTAKETAIQEAMNGKFFSISDDGNLIPIDEHKILSQLHDEDTLPDRIVITTKDSRPGTGTMQTYLREMPTLIDQLDNIDTPPENQLVIAAYHTHSNIFANTRTTISRIRQLRNNQQDRIEHMNPAALHISELLFDLVTEKTDEGRFALADNATEIMDRIVLAGYSQGGNIVTDAFRHLAMSLVGLNASEQPVKLIYDDTHHEDMDLEDVASLFQHSRILNVAAAEQPYTEAERKFMPPRLSIHNKQDRVIMAFNAEYEHVNHPKDQVIMIDTGKIPRFNGPHQFNGHSEETIFPGIKSHVRQKPIEGWANRTGATGDQPSTSTPLR